MDEMNTSAISKDYDLAFETRENYLFAYVEGEHDTYDICIRYWREVGDKLAELELDKVMIVEDIVEQSPLTDVFRLASELPDIGFRDRKIAFVDRYSERSATFSST